MPVEVMRIIDLVVKPVAQYLKSTSTTRLYVCCHRYLITATMRFTHNPRLTDEIQTYANTAVPSSDNDE